MIRGSAIGSEGIVPSRQRERCRAGAGVPREHVSPAGVGNVTVTFSAATGPWLDKLVASTMEVGGVAALVDPES